MNRTLQDQLTAEIDRGGQASIRNLALAEAAVLRGQFNLAKVLRTGSHATCPSDDRRAGPGAGDGSTRGLADDRGGERG